MVKGDGTDLPEDFVLSVGRQVRFSSGGVSLLSTKPLSSVDGTSRYFQVRILLLRSRTNVFSRWYMES